MVYAYLFKQNLENVLKNIEIWEDYILDIYIGLYKGTLEERMKLRQDVCIYCMLFVWKVHANQFSCIT